MQRQGNPQAEAALQRLIQRYGRWLREHAERLCPKRWGIRPEEIEQDVLLRLWQTLDAEKTIQNAPSYIYRVLTSAMIDELRRVRAKRQEPLHGPDGSLHDGIAQLASEDPSPQAVAGNRELLEKIERILARMPKERARVISLYLRGFTIEEVARLLGGSLPMARSLTYRSLQALRDELRSEGIEYENE